MKYFAYGSNMSLNRLQNRVPSAKRLGTFELSGYRLRFNKLGQDDSGKCNAHYTGNTEHRVIGAVFEMHENDRVHLDVAEGLGEVYEAKSVSVSNTSGQTVDTLVYLALNASDNDISPFSWYKKHVMVGAQESNLPANYINEIEAVNCVEDSNQSRRDIESAIHKE